MDLGQHWLMYWLVAWQHQAITWTNADVSLLRSSNNYLKAISQEIPQPSISKIDLKITYLNFNSNLPGAKELFLAALAINTLRPSHTHVYLLTNNPVMPKSFECYDVSMMVVRPKLNSTTPLPQWHPRLCGFIPPCTHSRLMIQINITKIVQVKSWHLISMNPFPEPMLN